MSNPIKTHQLIVTLPESHEIEAKILAPNIENFLRTARENGLAARTNGAVLGRASTALPYDKVTVTHVLGETPPDGLAVVSVSRGIYVRDYREGTFRRGLTALQARQLAGVLLAHAETIERNQADAKYAAHFNQEV